MCGPKIDGGRKRRVAACRNNKTTNRECQTRYIYLYICTHIRTHAHTHIGVNPNRLYRCDRGAGMRGSEVDRRRERDVTACQNNKPSMSETQYIYTYIHTHTHTLSLSLSHTHTHAHIHTRARAHPHTHAHPHACPGCGAQRWIAG